MNSLEQRKDGRDTLLAVVQKRSRNPALQAFGARLAGLRGKRTRQQISNKLRDLGAPLDASTLFQYEAGTVWAPDVAVLWGLSQIYGVAFSELVDLLRANRAATETNADDWRDLIRHGGTGKTDSPLGESDDPASARIRELEDRLEEYDRVFDLITGASRALAQALAAREKISTAGGAKSKARRHHRKVG